MKKTLFILLIFSAILNAQDYELKQVDPPQWWVGMHNQELMILFYGEGINKLTPVVDYTGVRITTVTRTENPNYIFLNLTIDENTNPGSIPIQFMQEDKTVLTHNYTLAKRKDNSAERTSFGPQDVVYLLMPDRYSNGDPSNDSVDELIEKANRSDQGGRHGGDIQGIINQLDYLQDMGVTAIWTTPVLEDNEKKHSYHTYAISNYYKIDARYGTNDDYARLAEECHNHGIKLIMDMVPNHCGLAHWWMNDLPMKDWVHEFPEFTRTNYRMSAWNDPYASDYDSYLNEKGWFDYTMPDLNHHNPLMLTYLKQFAIFWIEYANLDGLRVDTYPYNDKWKIAKWSKAIREEYPNLNLVGECWQHRPSEIAYWQSGTDNYDGYDSYLPSVMDFNFTDAMTEALNEDEQGWVNGMGRFYNNYVTDYLYADPYQLMIFADNHDTQRFATIINSDVKKHKLAMTHLFTTRGIPQIYYGTEILMGGDKGKGDGDIRRDFPGGWPDDQRDAFTEQGRTDQENEVFNHMKTLMNYRRDNPVLQTGQLKHFVPEGNVYVYFRMNSKKVVMVVLNNSTELKELDTTRYKEVIEGFSKGENILDGKTYDLDKLNLEAKSSIVLELK